MPEMYAWIDSEYEAWSCSTNESRICIQEKFVKFTDEEVTKFLTKECGSLTEAQEICEEENRSWPQDNFDPIRLDAEGKAKMFKFYMDRRSADAEAAEYRAAYEELENIENFKGVHYLVQNRINKKFYTASKMESANVAWLQKNEQKIAQSAYDQMMYDKKTPSHPNIQEVAHVYSGITIREHC